MTADEKAQVQFEQTTEEGLVEEPIHVPSHATKGYFEIAGGSGGYGVDDSGGAGRGALVKAWVKVNGGETLRFMKGTQAGYSGAVGFTRGGNGGLGRGHNGGGGGGSSALVRNTTVLIVAGGGGGAGGAGGSGPEGFDGGNGGSGGSPAQRGTNGHRGVIGAGGDGGAAGLLDRSPSRTDGGDAPTFSTAGGGGGGGAGWNFGGQTHDAYGGGGSHGVNDGGGGGGGGGTCYINPQAGITDVTIGHTPGAARSGYYTVKWA